MASTITLKKSSTPGNVPNNTNITTAELALNTADRILYSSDGINVFEIGANLTSQSVGDLTITGTITAGGGVGSAGQVLTSNGTGVEWTTSSGSGDVSKVGTPANNQVGVWTGDGTIEGDSNLTWNGSIFDINGSIDISNSITEGVHSLSGTSVALDPANGTIQTHTLTGATTYTDSFSAGQSITLMIDDGTAYTITWPTMTWVNNAGVAPTLATTGYTVVSLWKVSTTLYGALVGDGT